MKRVILESPYAGDIERNTRYARACVKDCLIRDEAPIASHLLYTQPGILDDSVPHERGLGILAGLAWSAVAEHIVFYTDLGMSSGMQEALNFYNRNGRTRSITLRNLPAMELAKVLSPENLSTKLKEK